MGADAPLPVYRQGVVTNSKRSRREHSDASISAAWARLQADRARDTLVPFGGQNPRTFDDERSLDRPETRKDPCLK